MRALFYFILLLIANFAALKFTYAQDATRFIGLVGFLVGVFAIFQFSTSIASLISGIKLNYIQTITLNSGGDKSKARHLRIASIVFIATIAVHVVFYVYYFSHQSRSLDRDGVKTTAIIIDKKWDRRGESWTGAHFVTYKYLVKNKPYNHSIKSDLYEIGDTLTIIYLPKNPNHHRVVKSE